MIKKLFLLYHNRDYMYNLKFKKIISELKNTDIPLNNSLISFRNKYEIIRKNNTDYIIIADIESDIHLILDEKSQVFICDDYDDCAEYTAKNLKSFIDILMLYLEYAEKCSILDKVEKLKNKISSVDNTVFSDENSYWSVMIEELEYSADDF